MPVTPTCEARRLAHSSIAPAFPDYEGCRLFALDTAGERRRQQALFRQCLTYAVGKLPACADIRIDQADAKHLSDYRERLLTALTAGSLDLAKILGGAPPTRSRALALLNRLSRLGWS